MQPKGWEMLRSRARTETRRVWMPPLASVGILFVLFLTAMITRRLGLGEPGRITMITLSSVAGTGIAAYGGKMIADARSHGWPSALAGLVMAFLGIYTLLHVLR